MARLFRQALSLLALFTAVLGLVYPGVVTGLGRLVFRRQASGMLISAGGARVGSLLIGQGFTRPECFWGRPSATAAFPYDASASAGSNLAPSNPALRAAVRDRVAALRASDPGNALPVPVDLVTASGSGLDPHISPAAAYYQVPRIARLRGLSQARVGRLVDAHIEDGSFGLFGEPKVNVLLLNLALDSAAIP